MATFHGIFRVPHILKERHVGEELKNDQARYKRKRSF